MKDTTEPALTVAPGQRPQRPVADGQPLPEPCVEVASRWWPELPNVYTPIGWKNHLFRFNVFYDGSVLAQPNPPGGIDALAAWDGLGAHLMIMPSNSGHHPYPWRSGKSQLTTDGGRRWGYQGWTDDDAPVLWTDWRQSYHGLRGIVLREEVFAHVPGGHDIETGTEPLFAWIRVSVADRNPMVQREKCGFLVQVTRPHARYNMYVGRNLILDHDEATYPRELRCEGAEGGGGVLLEPDGTVRLGASPGPGATAGPFEPEEDIPHLLLWAEMPAQVGAYVDLLLPMIPQKRAAFEKELRLRRAAALAECNRYWAKRPATAATIETPEPFVNSFLRRNIQFGEVIAQKMPESDHYTNLTGSLIYSRVWATPTTMIDTMLLDTLGYHGAVDRYLEILRAAQGTAKPPGPSYENHRGYLATPRPLSAYDWLSDHGAILHAACHHALLSDDGDFVDRWLGPILSACEFIRDSRARTDHEGVPGVIPPAIATDRNVPTQAVWNVGWHYKGLTSAIQLLRRLGHGRAEEFAEEAEDFRAVFLEALRRETEKSPTWTDAEGREHHLVPTSLSPGTQITHAFYLDTGPLSVVYLGLLDADDPLIESSLRFFREGPNHRLYDPAGHHDQPPVLLHELSSCEPCFSWGFFHAHQSCDRYRFFEGMYSLLTGAHSRKTHIQCETRGGITGIPAIEAVYLIRLCVVDDAIEDDSLHLLRLVPRAWLSESGTTRFEDIPTIFGPVSVSFRLEGSGTRLHVTYSHRFHHPPKRVVLHTPPVEGLAEMVINGKAQKVGPGDVDAQD